MSFDFTNFKDNNPLAEIIEKDDGYLFEKLWNDDSFSCFIKKDNDFSILDNIVLVEEQVAIFHKNESLVEYIFAPLNPSDIYLKRKFSFNFRCQKYNCYFDRATRLIEFLAGGFSVKSEDTVSNFRNLRSFSRFFKKTTLSQPWQDFYKDKVPYSFFIKGDFKSIHFDYVGLAKHLNFYMNFFDRKSPAIVIVDKQEKSEQYRRPCYSEKCDFPEIISGREINPIILDTLTIASDTKNIRLKYLFYFQVLEYCAYYYLNDDLKNQIAKILKTPDVACKPEHYSRFLIDEFKNYFRQNDDASKLDKTVSDFCTLEDLKLELKENINFFCQDIRFEGGYVLNALLKDDASLDNPANSKTVIKNIKDNIEKIRNVLVHLRESRENKVILPTRKNDNLLRPYLYLLQRIAEKVAIQFD